MYMCNYLCNLAISKVQGYLWAPAPMMVRWVLAPNPIMAFHWSEWGLGGFLPRNSVCACATCHVIHVFRGASGHKPLLIFYQKMKIGPYNSKICITPKVRVGWVLAPSPSHMLHPRGTSLQYADKECNMQT